jgi:predicted dehydrogenase
MLPRPRIRIGVLGCGCRGLEHIASLHTLKSRGWPVEIVAVSDVFAPRREQARRLTGAQAFTSWESVLERPGIDAVVIAAPDHWHGPMAKAALDAGKHVYLEPPLALSWEHVEAMRNAARTSGHVLHPGLPELHDARWAAVRDLCERGDLGPIRWSQVALPAEGQPRAGQFPDAAIEERFLDWKGFLGPASSQPFSPPRFLKWSRYRDFSGGPVMALHFSGLAPLLAATGDRNPLRVSAAGGMLAEDGGDVPDAFTCTLEYPSGHTVVLVRGGSGARGIRTVVRGELASVEFRPQGLAYFPESVLEKNAGHCGAGLWPAPETDRQPVFSDPEAGQRPAPQTTTECLTADLAQWLGLIRRGESSPVFDLACEAQAAALLSERTCRSC